jgi:hypothetical protein
MNDFSITIGGKIYGIMFALDNIGIANIRSDDRCENAFVVGFEMQAKVMAAGRIVL